MTKEKKGGESNSDNGSMHKVIVTTFPGFYYFVVLLNAMGH